VTGGLRSSQAKTLVPPFLLLPPVNRPQVPGGCPLTARSLPLSLSLYLTFLLTFSVPLPRSRVFSASSSRGSLLSVRRSLPIVWTAQPVDARYFLARGRRHVLVKYGSPTNRRQAVVAVSAQSDTESASSHLTIRAILSRLLRRLCAFILRCY